MGRGEAGVRLLLLSQPRADDSRDQGRRWLSNFRTSVRARVTVGITVRVGEGTTRLNAKG